MRLQQLWVGNCLKYAIFELISVNNFCHKHTTPKLLFDCCFVAEKLLFVIVCRVISEKEKKDATRKTSHSKFKLMKRLIRFSIFVEENIDHFITIKTSKALKRASKTLV
ncbi:CLUMA_CG019330, isoform A [Clunio marinus]|uniref:CLUMA_CG019330, isoform A n=1 Tax=Clunio marinus TaxID=568069 RepID=A0A1J1J197_9DIPT|nr:CLUMA_CG019330, isoform A [Clunio marinus]